MIPRLSRLLTHQLGRVKGATHLFPRDRGNPMVQQFFFGQAVVTRVFIGGNEAHALRYSLLHKAGLSPHLQFPYAGDHLSTPLHGVGLLEDRDDLRLGEFRRFPEESPGDRIARKLQFRMLYLQGKLTV